MDETIRKVDGKFVVYPKRGGKRLGTHDTEKDAKKQLAAIEISKAQNEDLDEGRGASPSYCKSTPCKDMGFTQKASCKSQGIKDCYKNEAKIATKDGDKEVKASRGETEHFFVYKSGKRYIMIHKPSGKALPAVVTKYGTKLSDFQKVMKDLEDANIQGIGDESPSIETLQSIKDVLKKIDERCQKGYKTHPTRKTKVMFGKRYRNCVKAEESAKSRRYDPRNYVGRDAGRRFDAGSDGKIPPVGLYGEDIEINEADPKKGTGKKPEGSGRRLYTDENPKDTVSVEFKSVAAIKRTLAKPSFKSKSHKRQSQIINLIHQRARAAYKNAKDPKVKARLKRAFEYAEQRKEASKKKTKARMKKKKKNKNEDVRKMPNSNRYGVYADKFKDGKRVMTPGGKHAQELKKTYASKKDANDYMAAIMIAKGG